MESSLSSFILGQFHKCTNYLPVTVHAGKAGGKGLLAALFEGQKCGLPENKGICFKLDLPVVIYHRYASEHSQVPPPIDVAGGPLGGPYHLSGGVNKAE